MDLASRALLALLASGSLAACLDDPTLDDPLASADLSLLGIASPLADYELGDRVRVTRIMARDADDAAEVRGWNGDVIATKAAGELGLTIDPVAFGAPAGLAPIHLDGVAVDPETLRLTADVGPLPGQDTLFYDGQTSIERIIVDVTLRAEWIPAGQQGDCRWTGCTNVRFVVQPGSRVTARLNIEVIPGSGVLSYDRDVTALPLAIDATGGLAHARTSRIELQSGTGSYLTGRARLCASTRARAVYGVVTTDLPAREHGLTVPIVSTDPSLRPSGAQIDPARTTGMFWLHVPAGWTGTSRLVADDGSWHGIELEVAPCVARTDPFPVRPLDVPYPLGSVPRPGCLACVLADLDSRGDVVVSTTSGPVVYRPEVGAWKPLPLPAGHTVSQLFVDDLGHVVVGARTATGKLDATRFELGALGWEAVALGALDPRAVEGPLTVGADLHGKPAWAVRFGAALAAPTLGQVAGPITAVADQTVAVDVAGGDVAVDLLTGATTALGLAAEKVEVTGGDGHRRLIGVARDAAGKERGFVHDVATGQRTALGVLPAASSSRPIAINDHGWIVGTSGGQTFLYRPGVGMEALSSLIDPQAGLTIVEPLAITDHGQVLVAGKAGGALGLHLVSLVP